MIEYFELVMRPIEYGPNVKEIKVKIVVDGLEHHYRRILRPNDLESYYDVIFEEAKQQLKMRIDKHKDNNLHLTVGNKSP